MLTIINISMDIIIAYKQKEMGLMRRYLRISSLGRCFTSFTKREIG